MQRAPEASEWDVDYEDDYWYEDDDVAYCAWCQECLFYETDGEMWGDLCLMCGLDAIDMMDARNLPVMPTMPRPTPRSAWERLGHELC